MTNSRFTPVSRGWTPHHSQQVWYYHIIHRTTMSKDDGKFQRRVDKDLPSSTDRVDDDASDTNNNDVTLTENRPSEEEDTRHHDHDLKVSTATTLSGTASQQQAEDSPQSYNRRLSLLSQTWQQHRHAHQTEATLLNRGLPPSYHHQNHAIDAAQLSTMSGTRQLGLNEPPSLHQSMLGHSQRPQHGLNEPLSLHQSLLGHSQHLAMNNSYNQPVFPLSSEMASSHAQSSMPMPLSLLEQIQQALTIQNLSVNQFAPQAIIAHLLQQQPSVPHNPSYFPMTSHVHQYQTQVNQIQEYIRVNAQITALLLMQQQQGITNAAPSATSANPEFNSYNSMMQEGHPGAMAMINQEHPAMAMMNLRNHMQQGGGSQPIAMSSADTAAAPVFNPFQHSSSLIASNMMFDVSLAATQSTTVASQQRHSTTTPSHDAKEKRWLIRYEELQQFHAVSFNN